MQASVIERRADRLTANVLVFAMADCNATGFAVGNDFFISDSCAMTRWATGNPSQELKIGAAGLQNQFAVNFGLC